MLCMVYVRCSKASHRWLFSTGDDKKWLNRYHMDTPSGALDDAAGSLCGNADLLVVEDLEAFVCGTEQWQRGCAFFFQNIIEDGTDVIAAADDPAKTAPEFWYRMTCACPFSVRTLKE